MNAVVRSDKTAPVLVEPGAKASGILGWLSSGSRVNVVEVVQNEAMLWAKLELIAGGILLVTSDAKAQVFGYVAADYFIDKLQPPNPSLTKVQVGIAVVYGREAAHAAAKAGCRFFCITGHPALGSEMKDAYPDAVVVVRPLLDVRGGLPGYDYVLNQLNGARDARLIYTGVNESEQIGVDVDAIRKRAWFDVEMARRIKAISGAVYAAASYSTGTPDITKPEICDAIRQYYAPSYNSGLLWWDQHLYSPNMQHIYREDVQTPTWNGKRQIVVEHEWFETRWHFLFTRCGFEPASPSRILSTETGMDEGGVGGFPAHKATEQAVLSWCSRFLTIQGQAITVDGIQYPSPFIGGAIFQMGDMKDWAGYDMTDYLPAMSSQVWAAPMKHLSYSRTQTHVQATEMAMNVLNLSRDVNRAVNELGGNITSQTGKDDVKADQ